MVSPGDAGAVPIGRLWPGRLTLGGAAFGPVTTFFNGMHLHWLSGSTLLLAAGLLATTVQLPMTRAYGIGRTLTWALPFPSATACFCSAIA